MAASSLLCPPSHPSSSSLVYLILSSDLARSPRRIVHTHLFANQTCTSNIFPLTCIVLKAHTGFYIFKLLHHRYWHYTHTDIHTPEGHSVFFFLISFCLVLLCFVWFCLSGTATVRSFVLFIYLTKTDCMICRPSAHANILFFFRLLFSRIISSIRYWKSSLALWVSRSHGKSARANGDETRRGKKKSRWKKDATCFAMLTHRAQVMLLDLMNST